jgi:hypothetical protein
MEMSELIKRKLRPFSILVGHLFGACLMFALLLIPVYGLRFLASHSELYGMYGASALLQYTLVLAQYLLVIADGVSFIAYVGVEVVRFVRNTLGVSEKM